MTNKVFFLILSILFLSCSSDDDRRNDNPNLIDPLVSISLSLSLPQYDALNFPGGNVLLTQQGAGIRGIVVYNVNNDQYTAFELSDPNHPPNSCSRMTVEAPIASCPCESDNNEYNIITGEHTTDPTLYPMQQYRVIREGNTIRISN